MHLALAVVSGGSRMEGDYRGRGAVRIHLATNMSGNLFEERTRQLIDDLRVEVRATDEQEINTHGMQRDVLTRIRPAGKQGSSQERIVDRQAVHLRAFDLHQSCAAAKSPDDRFLRGL